MFEIDFLTSEHGEATSSIWFTLEGQRQGIMRKAKGPKIRVEGFVNLGTSHQLLEDHPRARPRGAFSSSWQTFFYEPIFFITQFWFLSPVFSFDIVCLCQEGKEQLSHIDMLASKTRARR